MSLCEIQKATGNMFLVENPVGASGWSQSSIKRLRSAPFSFEGISHLCMFGVEDPRSRRALKSLVKVFDKQSTGLEVCRSKVPEQTCSRRTLERISEFVSLAHTRLGTSGDPRSGERCSQKA